VIAVAEPGVMPLYGFIEGDTLGVVVLVRPDETARDLARHLIEAASVRVARTDEARVRVRDEILSPNATLRSAGITPLDRVDLVWQPSHNGVG
jgi:hypothetical protein